MQNTCYSLTARLNARANTLDYISTTIRRVSDKASGVDHRHAHRLRKFPLRENDAKGRKLPVERTRVEHCVQAHNR